MLTLTPTFLVPCNTDVSCGGNCGGTGGGGGGGAGGAEVVLDITGGGELALGISAVVSIEPVGGAPEPVGGAIEPAPVEAGARLLDWLPLALAGLRFEAPPLSASDC